jgi:hypothetical protein
VKKVTLYLLILLFLNNITYDQMLKVPVLVQHYHEHHQRDQQIGLLDFLDEK